MDPQSEVQLTLLTGASSGISEGSATVLEEGAALVMSEGAVQEGDNASLLRKELQAGEDEGTEVIERELALKQVHELEDMFDQSPRRRGDSAWWEAGEGGDLEAGPPTSAVK